MLNKHYWLHVKPFLAPLWTSLEISGTRSVFHMHEVPLEDRPFKVQSHSPACSHDSGAEATKGLVLHRLAIV